MAQHIFSGSGAPATTPTAIGQHYVDTLNGNSYLSVGTTSSGDWKLAGSAGSGSSAIAIGTSIISGITGSILFIGDGLAQDNSNLFYDDANNTLIGTNVRTNNSLQFKDFSAGGSALINMYAPTLSAGYTLRLPVDDGTASQVLTTDGNGILSWTTVSGGSGSSMISIGISVQSGTSGSILFIGNGLAQDNANLFFDDVNNRLITEHARLNNSLQFKDNSTGGSNLITIYGTSLAAGYTLRLPVDDGTPNQVLTTDGTGILSWTTASGGAGSSMISIGISVQSGTTGSVLFIGDGLAQNNSQFYWDNTNFRLGLGVTNPVTGLHSTMTVRSNAGFRLQDNSGGTLTVTIRGASIAAGFTLTLPKDDGLDGQVLVSAGGTGLLAWRGQQMSFFGSGSVGNTTISSDITLASNQYYNNLTINSGVNVAAAGFMIFVKGELNHNGTIRNNGSNGVNSGGPGAAGGQGVFGANGAGGQGSTAAGFVGSSVLFAMGSTGGAGGAGSGGAGGNGGPAVAITAANGGPSPYQSSPLLGIWGAPATTNKYAAGAGGGGGGGDGTTGGAGGGGGGGMVYVAAQRIYGTGVFEAIGGNGGNGSATNRGGGGGGGGGFITVVSLTGVDGCSFNVSGGQGGAGGGGSGLTGGIGFSGSFLNVIMGVDV